VVAVEGKAIQLHLLLLLAVQVVVVEAGRTTTVTQVLLPLLLGKVTQVDKVQ
jgi:hypothetical protein